MMMSFIVLVLTASCLPADYRLLLLADIIARACGDSHHVDKHVAAPRQRQPSVTFEGQTETSGAPF